MAFSDTFEGAIPLTYGNSSDVVPADGLTADAIDPDWGMTHSAWWKVTVPDDHDPTHYVRVQVSQSYLTTPGDGAFSPWLIVWQGATRETAEAVDWGNDRWLTFQPGDEFYIEVGMHDGDDTTGGHYVVGVSEVYSYYTPWIQGPDVTMPPTAGYHARADTRQQRVGPGIPDPPYLPQFGPAGGYQEVMDPTLLALGGEGSLYYNAGPNDGTIVGAGGYGSVVELNAKTPSGEDQWIGTGSRDDVGTLFYPDVSAFKSGYAGTLVAGAEGYEGDLQWVQLESWNDWEVTSVNFTIPLLKGASSGTARLYIRTYVRAATYTGDHTDPGELYDQRLWQGGGETYTSTELNVATTRVSPSIGGCVVYPVSDTNYQTPPWVGSDPGEPVGPEQTSRARYDVVYDVSRDPVMIGASLHPPRHRYRMQVIQDPAPPVLPAIAGQVGETRRVFS